MNKPTAKMISRNKSSLVPGAASGGRYWDNRTYELSEPYHGYRFIALNFDGMEMRVFGCSAPGKPDHKQLPGSGRNVGSHESVIASIGYSLLR